MSDDHSHQKMSTQERVEAARATCEAAGRRFTDLRAHVFELIVEDGGARPLFIGLLISSPGWVLCTALKR